MGHFAEQVKWVADLQAQKNPGITDTYE